MNDEDVRRLLRDVTQRLERATPKRRYTPDERRALGITRAALQAERRNAELAHLEAVLTALIDAMESES